MVSLISSETETSGPQKSERVNFYCFLIYICYFICCIIWDLSSLTRDGICAPAVVARNCNQQTTREVPNFYCFKPSSLW